jgi:tRNA A-37 threonylcarbamoyl transferase component Bud32
MADRDLIVGVLAVRSGFVSPAQVMAAASAWLAESKGEPLAARLEADGLLTAQRRKLVEELADEAFAIHAGDGKRAIESLGGEAALSSTYGISLRGLAPDAATWIADAARALPEERPGQYTRLGELGRGAQSIVHRAIDEFIGREVALKELLPIGPGDLAPSSPAARVRFLREARLTAQLDHPGIVAVHELARRPDGTLFCSQKLVRGETLRTRLARCPSLKERLQLLPHLIGACHAVAYAHSHGVVHRDLKPSNIMVGAFGETVVVDWGLATKAPAPRRRSPRSPSPASRWGPPPI